MTSKQWKQTFANRLSRAIESSGMEKKEIAEAANVSLASISQYVNGGQVPTATAVINLANVLNVDPSYLVDFGDVVEK